MSEMINFTIDGRKVSAKKGETILKVARREGIYIPTMCYLEKTNPAASCRLCVVEAEGVDGMVLSCQTPPTEGLAVITNNNVLHEERTNIMRLYDVNHPLECGVCDKSGACDLQNKTLEFNVGAQHFTAKEQSRKIEHWGLINYDPNLCIMCEKCTHVCNEVIGDDAIELKFGGYKSTIIPKNSEQLDCTFCGECIAVCPVGALVSADFQYKANAWELERIPSTCAHCSAGCALEYEVKTSGAAKPGEERIFRVTNNFEFASLCGAGRFGFDFDVKGEKNGKAFVAALDAIKGAEAIRFSSVITNEEALILQRLKEKTGLKLYNEDARRYGAFVDAFGSTADGKAELATMADLKASDGIVVIGSRIGTDNPALRYAMTTAARHRGAKIVYMHPLEDALMQNVVTQFIKYEVGTEEGVMALLVQALLAGVETNKTTEAFLEALDDGYLSAESNVGEEELALIGKQFKRAKAKTLVLGSDLFAHPRAENIAKLAGLLARFGGYKVVVAASEVNTVGVSLVCDLDADSGSNAGVVGYNAAGGFVIAADADADLTVAAMNQQEGTVVNLDRQLLPMNVAVGFEGYVLNDLANALGVGKRYTIDFTPELPAERGFKPVAFDALENFYSPLGEDKRGYRLEKAKKPAAQKCDEVEELPEFNGTVVYACNPVLQFNRFTARTAQLEKNDELRGSEQFAVAARLGDGDLVVIGSGDAARERRFVIDPSLKGTIALEPTFDRGLSVDPGAYRFEKVNIMKASNDE
ncbi:2Fe-2S iron-sulfur cluster-binding protein [Sulfurimonas sp. HSL-1656]|uniref:2Fe-2S iron-sulfur cluster-binding protein n=1 Tax=Thiomicrolovo subterrani TaxID=3131934 RepID=UPI0031F78305